MIPVRSAKPVPKEKIMDCMEAIRGSAAEAPVRVYDVLIENVCGTGVDIVATGEA